MPNVVFETAAKFLKRLAQVCIVSVLHWLESLSLVDKAPCWSGKCSDLRAMLELKLPYLEYSLMVVVTVVPSVLQSSVVRILHKNK